MLPDLTEQLTLHADEDHAAPVLSSDLTVGLPFGKPTLSISSPGKVSRLLSN